MKWLAAVVRMIWTFVKMIVVGSCTVVVLTATFLVKAIEGIAKLLWAITLLLLLLSMAAGMLWVLCKLLF